MVHLLHWVGFEGVSSLLWDDCSVARPGKRPYINDAIGLVVRGILCYEPLTIYRETALSYCQIIDIWAKTGELKATATQM